MEFEILCETYCRLVKLPLYYKTDDPAFNEMKTIRIEFTETSILAIAAHNKFMAIEKIGENLKKQSGKLHLIVSPELLAQCEVEKNFGGKINVAFSSMLNFTTAKTTMGFNLPYSFSYLAETPLFDKWRNWMPDKPVTKTNGPMYLNGEKIGFFHQLAPSGSIVFPEFIDNTKPIIVRDHVDENWIGVFMPNVIDDNGKLVNLHPAIKPDWI